MVFKDLEVNNFRGIKSAKLENFSNVNFLFGKNNSGKTSIIESLFLLLDITNPTAILRIDELRSLIHDAENDFSFPFYKLEYHNEIFIKANHDENESYRSLIIKPLNNKNLKKLRKNTTSETDYTTSVNEISGLEYLGNVKYQHQQKQVLENYIQMLRNRDGTILFETGNNSNKYTEKNYGLIVSSTNRISQNLTARLEKIIVEKKKKEIIKILNEVDYRISDFEILTKNMIYFDAGFDKLIPANLMGDGSLKILSLIADLYTCKNGVLFLDELENGLHYKNLKLALRIIFKYSIEYNVQLFITSHNYELVKFILEVIEEDKNEIFKDKISSYTISKNNNDEISSLLYKYDDLKIIASNNIEIRGQF